MSISHRGLFRRYTENLTIANFQSNALDIWKSTLEEFGLSGKVTLDEVFSALNLPFTEASIKEHVAEGVTPYGISTRLVVSLAIAVILASLGRGPRGEEKGPKFGKFGRY